MKSMNYHFNWTLWSRDEEGMGIIEFVCNFSGKLFYTSTKWPPKGTLDYVYTWQHFFLDLWVINKKETNKSRKQFVFDFVIKLLCFTLYNLLTWLRGLINTVVPVLMSSFFWLGNYFVEDSVISSSLFYFFPKWNLSFYILTQCI